MSKRKNKVVQFPTSYPGDDYEPPSDSEVTLEAITWYDHCSHYDQLLDQEALQKIYDEGLTKRTTVGYVLHQDAEAIYIAGTQDPDGRYSEVTVLGTALVLKRKVLK